MLGQPQQHGILRIRGRSLSRNGGQRLPQHFLRLRRELCQFFLQRPRLNAAAFARDRVAQMRQQFQDSQNVFVLCRPGRREPAGVTGSAGRAAGVGRAWCPAPACVSSHFAAELRCHLRPLQLVSGAGPSCARRAGSFPPPPPPGPAPRPLRDPSAAAISCSSFCGSLSQSFIESASAPSVCAVSNPATRASLMDASSAT